MTPPDRKTPPSDQAPHLLVMPELVQFTAMVQGLQEAARGLTRGLEKAVLAVPTLPAFDFKALLEPIQAMAAAVQTLPERTRLVATKAALRGWFIGPLIPLSATRELEGLEDGEAIDALFAAQYREDWPEVEHLVLERLPARSHLLGEAFRAHREGRYALSIPVFLAQAEGLCDDALKGRGHLFSTKEARVQERIRFMEDLLAQEDSRFVQAILEPLKAALPSSAPIHLWEASKDTLNRHAVLHGGLPTNVQ